MSVIVVVGMLILFSVVVYHFSSQKGGKCIL